MKRVYPWLTLVFYTLSGWMHEADTIHQFTVSFDKDWIHFQIQKKTVAEKVFKKIPKIMY